MVLIHSRAKRIHGQVIASVAAIVALALLAACENPMADLVAEARVIAVSPAISVVFSSDTAAIDSGSTRDLGTITYSTDESTALLYTVAIKNSGHATLSVDTGAVALSAPEGQAAGVFSIRSLPDATIGVGESSSIVIAVVPKVAGTIQATLRIPSNAYLNQAFSVTVKAYVDASSVLERVATPTASVAAGTYTVAQAVSLACSTAGATIRYKTDGSSPSDSSGEIYVDGSPISVPIGGLSRIRAIAYKANYAVSGMLSADIQVKPGTAGTPTVGTSTLSMTRVSLSWSAGTGATGYEISRGTQSGGGDRATISPGPSDATTSFIDESAVPGTTYYYWVRSTSPGGTSDWSPASPSVTTKTNSTAWAKTVASGDGRSSYVGIAADTSDGSYYAIAALRAGGSGYPDASIDYSIGGLSISFAKASMPQSIPALVKYDQYGSATWIRSLSSVTNTAADCRFTGVSVNSVSHRITVVGYTCTGTGTFNFPNGKSFTTTVQTTAFIMQFSSDGTLNWISTGGGAGTSKFRDIAADGNGNAYAIGSITGTASFSGQSVSSSGDYQGVIVKYGSDGTAVGVLSPSAVGTLDKAVVDAAGNLYCTGNTSPVNNGYAVTMKFDSSLQSLWTKGVTVTCANPYTYLMPNGLWVDGSGTVYVACNSYGSDSYYADIDWGDGFTTSCRGSRPYLITYSGSDGTTLFARTLAESTGSFSSASSDDYGNIAIASDGDGDIYIATTVNGSATVDFGNGVTVAPSYSGENAIIVKFDSDGSALWAQSTVAATQDSLFYDLVYTGNGSLITAGMWKNKGGNSVGFGNANTVSGGYQESWPAEGENALIVKYAID
ncbi:MAG TPA: chitobiase/beta-hexosaminidase C-terminal domain-containing protein [Spirochaetales bacterium]|nr:chitobiase/beta-hexosaminidase C-terminal domain-containing protein [Spirochaetales bacterium]